METILGLWASSPDRLRINTQWTMDRVTCHYGHHALQWKSCVVSAGVWILCLCFLCELEPDSNHHSSCQGRWQRWGWVTLVLYLQWRCDFALPWLRRRPLLPALFSVSLAIPLCLRGGSQLGHFCLFFLLGRKAGSGREDMRNPDLSWMLIIMEILCAISSYPRLQGLSWS